MSANTTPMTLAGRSLIGEERATAKSKLSRRKSATGLKLEPAFYSATSDDIDQAATLATEAFII